MHALLIVFAPQQRQRYGVRHRLIPSVVRVQVITGVKGRPELERVRRIGNRRGEVDYAVEFTARPSGLPAGAGRMDTDPGKPVHLRHRSPRQAPSTPTFPWVTSQTR
jgi:hypothetical protein